MRQALQSALAVHEGGDRDGERALIPLNDTGEFTFCVLTSHVRLCPQGMAAPEPPAPSSGMYKLEMELKRGHNLAVRDRGGEV